MARLSLLMLLALVVTLNLASGSSRRRVYENDYDKDLNFQCPKNQVLSEIYSIHSNEFEDRKFDLKCKPLTVSYCKWDKFSTYYGQNWQEICKGRGVLAGIKSEHSNQQEDRRFRFLCCSQYDTGMRCKAGNLAVSLQISPWAILTVAKGKQQLGDRGLVIFLVRALRNGAAKTPRYCGWSKWTYYDREINYKVPRGKVIKGMMSFHNNDYEDRKFKFWECSV